MNAAQGPQRYEPLTPMRASLRWLAILLAAIVGAAEIAATYLALAPRLPAEIPTHYNAQGVADSFGPPGQFVVAGVVTELALGVIMAALFASMSRDVPLQRRHARSALDPAAGLLVLTLLVVLPLAWVGALLQPANAWPLTTVPAWLVALIIMLGGAAITAFLAIRAAKAAPREVPDALGELYHYHAAQSGPIFLCTSCGKRHVRSAWWLLTPRIGVSAVEGGASYYLTCPVCGERGWFPRVGWSHAGAHGADRPTAPT